MLLANRASAKLLGDYGIFRVHLLPEISKIEELLEDLATVGIFVENYTDVISLIGASRRRLKRWA